jgi:16S rRNA (uracil1498-N3)-methyltransferase
MHYRFFIDPLPDSGEVTLRGDEFHHAARVVRVREGETIELFDGHGRGQSATVTTLDRDHLVATIGPHVDPRRESRSALTLAMAIIQLEKFELVLQNATELGARSIIPMTSARCEVRPERYRGKAERWEKIVFEAAKQAGRLTLPIIEPPAAFADVVRRETTRILFDADADPHPSGAIAEAIILIGPEGGWTEEELDLARGAGVQFRRLGSRRLRAETAAIASLAVLAAEAGDLS